MGNRGIWNYTVIDASPFHGSEASLVPEEAYRGALKSDKEEVEGGEGEDYRECDVDDEFVDGVDGYSEEEDCDGEADNKCRCSV